MYIRRWLNKEGRAFIEAEFNEFGDGASVHIGDCHRVINLDFFVYKKSEFKSRIAKLDILIETLQQVRNHLSEQMKK